MRSNARWLVIFALVEAGCGLPTEACYTFTGRTLNVFDAGGGGPLDLGFPPLDGDLELVVDTTRTSTGVTVRDQAALFRAEDHTFSVDALLEAPPGKDCFSNYAAEFVFELAWPRTWELQMRGQFEPISATMTPREFALGSLEEPDVCLWNDWCVDLFLDGHGH